MRYGQLDRDHTSDLLSVLLSAQFLALSWHMAIEHACLWPIIPPWYARQRQQILDLPRRAAFVLNANKD